ncbi:MAG TPA: hypothetical protein VF240_17245 [Pyrinomonadaceae bacterium]
MAQQGRQNVLDNYVTVAERVAAFYQTYPQGRINTQIIQHDTETGFILMRAEIYRSTDDASPSATGHAFEVRSESYVNKTSYIENAETSSVGRALALLGFEVRRGIASREEMDKTARMQPPERAPVERAPAEKPSPSADKAATRAAAPKAEEEPPADINAEILQAAAVLGYDAAKVRKWVNQRFEVTGGLESLTNHDKSEILQVFREKAQSAQTKAAQR